MVATTRPETMLGDTGVAVHPDDERYKDLVGRNAILPLVGRRLRIVADSYADPETGSGAVKITPAHDFNDFEVGKRAGLPAVSIFDTEANVVLHDNADFSRNVPAGEELLATIAALDRQDRYTARKRVVAMMEERGLVEKIEDHVHTVPHGDRSGVAIEPFLTDQWYVDAKTLASAGDRVGPRGAYDLHPEDLGEDLFRVDGEHPALVRLAPALVGPPDPGLVWSEARRRQSLFLRGARMRRSTSSRPERPTR